jgi:alanine racemase
MIRPGIALYGALPSADFEGKMDLKPVMHLRSKVAMLKWVDMGNSVSYARRFVAERKTWWPAFGRMPTVTPR